MIACSFTVRAGGSPLLDNKILNMINVNFKTVDKPKRRGASKMDKILILIVYHFVMLFQL